MWFDDLPAESSWSRLWSGYILCVGCSGIRKVTEPCPTCQSLPPEPQWQTLILDGKEIKVPSVSMGAEGRYEDWVYLKMLEREWKRPLVDTDRFLDIADSARPSARAVIILIFWGYFENANRASVP